MPLSEFHLSFPEDKYVHIIFKIKLKAIWRPPVNKMDTVLFFFFASVGLTYEQSAVKLVVRVLKSGTVLYKTHAHISLLNVTFVCSCLLIYSI